MKTKRLWIMPIAAFILAVFIGGCKDENVENVGVCPLVVSTNPANLATNVPLDQVITVTFNEAMDPLTIVPQAFTLTGPVGSGRIEAGSNTADVIAGALTYDASNFTMSFRPSPKLKAGSTYTGTVATTVKDLMGNALQVDYVWTFSTGAIVSPTVISTDPANAATGVLLNKVVTATFSVPMDPLTLTATTFTVKRGTNPVAGTVSYTGSTASFTPTSSLKADSLYTATITTAVKNVAGNPLLSDYVWTFTTGSRPTVTATSPANNATGVFLNKVVTATFSVPMDPLTLTATTFTLKQGTVSIAGAITYTGSTASFTPTNPLIAGTLYTATITTGAKNTVGTALANNFVWTFTTGTVAEPTVISTDPLNLATGVALNKVVEATFSEAMDPLTITASTFTLKIGTTVVAGAVSYAGTTAMFTPSSNLLGGTTYTATVTTGAKNVGGVPLKNDFVWTFTTGIIAAPTVILTDPLNLATGVALNKVMSATFSEAMDPLTITASSFTLKIGTTSVAGAVNYSGTTATFTPTVALLSGTTYTATITTVAKNVAGIALANNFVWSFSTVGPLGPLAVDLKSVGRFGIIAGVGVSNNAGFSEIRNLDVGISPGVRSSITGFPPAIIVNGAMYASDDIAPPGVPAMLTQAKQDLTDAYLFAEAATSPAPATVAGDQGGLTLAPGIYKSTSTLLIQSGDLTLDAQGDANAVWIFQIASDFTTVGGAGGSVILSGGAQAKNVFWQVGSSATIGDFTAFKGNVLALTSITMNSGATAVGRMLARNGSVVMTSTNIIEKP